jgi:hypothetical protein
VTVDSDQVGRLARKAARGDEAAWKGLGAGFSGFVWSVNAWVWSQLRRRGGRIPDRLASPS